MSLTLKSFGPVILSQVFSFFGVGGSFSTDMLMKVRVGRETIATDDGINVNEQVWSSGPSTAMHSPV